jgi:hypothetical protein
MLSSNAELDGVLEKLTTILGGLYSPVCRAEFGSTSGSKHRCNVNLL